MPPRMSGQLQRRGRSRPKRANLLSSRSAIAFKVLASRTWSSSRSDPRTGPLPPPMSATFPVSRSSSPTTVLSRSEYRFELPVERLVTQLPPSLRALVCRTRRLTSIPLPASGARERSPFIPSPRETGRGRGPRRRRGRVRGKTGFYHASRTTRRPRDAGPLAGGALFGFVLVEHRLGRRLALPAELGRDCRRPIDRRRRVAHWLG